MTYRHLSFILFSILYSLFFIRPSHVLAQDLATDSATPPSTESGTLFPELPPPDSGVKLTVSPPVLNMKTEPGVPTTSEVRIKNFGEKTEDIRLTLMKFAADDTGAKPVLMDLDSGDLFPTWISLSENRFLLEPETWKTIKISFNPPENAAPAYYFALVFNREKEIEMTGGQVAKGAAAILVLSQISSSRVYHQLDLAQLDAKTIGFKTDRFIYEFLPVDFETSIVNNGNVHELAHGNIFIDWVTGNKNDVAILDVNAERSYILPQTKRTFLTSWTDGFPVWEEQKDDAGEPILDKDGKPTRKLKWDLSRIPTFRIGKYRANLLLAYNDGVRDIPLEAQAEFWVIPWRILLGLLVVIILIIIGFKGIIQNLFNKVKTAHNRMNPPSLPNP